MSDLLRGLAREARVPWGKVAGVAVGIPGVSGADVRVELAANIRGLEHLALASELRRLLRAPVRVENDVNLAAVGEQERGVAKGCSTFAVLALGTGVGLGLIVSGELVTGSRGAAGEIAYLPLGADPRAAESRRRGSLEVAASGSGVRALLATELQDGLTAPTTLTVQSTAREVYDVAGTDPVAAAVVARHAHTVALAILSVAAIVDPEMVVLAGGIGSNVVLLPAVRRALEEVAPFPVRVEVSTLGTRAGLVGALALAKRIADRTEVP
jgi:predicted NBD/HSP70 family sugar kinase